MFLLIPEYEQRVNIGSALREIFAATTGGRLQKRQVRMRKPQS
jgi:hypothetical protein